MTEDELKHALQKASFEAHRLGNEVDRLKYQLKRMRQELRTERAEHRQTMLKLEAALNAR